MPSRATRPPLVGMPAAWLRNNCPCPLCRNPVSGQRLLHSTDIPADIAVAEVIPSGRTVPVRFHPGGHRAVSDRDWLARDGEPARDGPPDPRTEDAKRLWSGDWAVPDNTRVLHARTGFALAGRRHLQGCYCDLDGVEPAVAVGERATTGVIRRKDGT
jgi:Gamma-butyrobetaine hydroxylase-like, N-terminal/Taurine catabolism dioxygenase TauD, TfdA family